MSAVPTYWASLEGRETSCWQSPGSSLLPFIPLENPGIAHSHSQATLSLAFDRNSHFDWKQTVHEAPSHATLVGAPSHALSLPKNSLTSPYLIVNIGVHQTSHTTYALRPYFPTVNFPKAPSYCSLFSTQTKPATNTCPQHPCPSPCLPLVGMPSSNQPGCDNFPQETHF